MLVAQAQAQFEWWTGQRPADRVMRDAAVCTPAARPVPIGEAMKQTTFEEFVDLAKRATFVPVCKELVADLLTPVSAFLKVAEHSDYAFLLESVEGGEHVGRYSFLGKDPFLILRGKNGETEMEKAGVTSKGEQAVHRHAARADEQLPVAVRARPAALHRRRRRLPGLRHRRLVRADRGPRRRRHRSRA